ncbi:MAG TPA: hypothetical protein PK778_05040 [Bacillota bacterium]|nr:hypothetical protein [Clostridiales bacterium]HPT85340.1 hypothetical protein [Bacillota bacterium]
MKKKKKAEKSQIGAAIKQINWKLFARLFLSFAVIVPFYFVCVYYRLKFVVHLYAITLLVLCLAYVILARGYSIKPLDESLLPDDWDAETKMRYLENDAKRKKIAKNLLYFIIPIMFTFMFDMIYINFFG